MEANCTLIAVYKIHTIRNIRLSTKYSDRSVEMPSYKLTYFNGRGRGEISRMIFTAAGVKFEDVRIEGDWPKLKSSK